MYYVIERKYVGPNPESNPLQPIFCITTQPGREQGSGEVKIEGELGTSENEVEGYAHGEFETLEDARNIVSEKTGGDYQQIERAQSSIDMMEESLVEAYCSATLPALSEQATRQIMRDFADMDIYPTTSDEDIEELAEEYMEEIRNTSFAEADREAIVDLLKEIRNKKIVDEESQE